MNDADTSIEQLKALVLAFSKERDWEQFHHPKDLGVALASEVGELLDHFRYKIERTDPDGPGAGRNPSSRLPRAGRLPLGHPPAGGGLRG